MSTLSLPYSNHCPRSGSCSTHKYWYQNYKYLYLKLGYSYKVQVRSPSHIGQLTSPDEQPGYVQALVTPVFPSSHSVAWQYVLTVDVLTVPVVDFSPSVTSTLQ